MTTKTKKTPKRLSKKPAKKSKQLADGLHLELEGQIYIIDKEPGKPPKRDRLDGKLALECIRIMIQDGLALYLKKLEREGK